MNIFQSASYKQKFYGLLLLAALVVFLVYKKSIASTLLLIGETHRLEKKVASDDLNDLQENLPLLKQRNEQYNQLLGENKDNEDSQSLLLEKVSQYCRENNLILARLPETEMQEEQGSNRITHRVAVQGSFLDLLKLNHELETNFPQLRLVAVDYAKQTNKRTQTETLYADFFLQHISRP